MVTWHHRRAVHDAPEDIWWISASGTEQGGPWLAQWAATHYGTHAANRPPLSAMPANIRKWAICEPGKRCALHPNADVPRPPREDPYTVAMRANFAFQRKITNSLAIITKALMGSKRPYVAFSGGKDSLAVAGLVSSVIPEVQLLWTDDELEYPETVDFMRLVQKAQRVNLIVKTGGTMHAGWFTPWKGRPFWREPLEGTLMASDQRADQMMASMGYDLTFTGVRASESRARRRWLERVYLLGDVGDGASYPVATGTRRRCCPIWDWTEDDVWLFIRKWGGNAYNKAYDRLEEIGVSRERQRIGPLPLTPRATLAEGWPDLLAKLEVRYGPRWNRRR